MLDASDYVGEDGADTTIQIGKLLQTIAGSVVVALGAGYINLIETGIQLQIRSINALGGFFASWIGAVLGESAALYVDSWRAAFVASLQFDAFAPFILVVEALLILALALAIWNRRPYA